MAGADQKDTRESPFAHRATLFAFGAVFLFFAARDLVWSGGISIIAVLSAIPAFAFIAIALFGSKRLIWSLFKLRMVPGKSEEG